MLEIWELLLLPTAGIRLPSKAKGRVGWCSSLLACSPGCSCPPLPVPRSLCCERLPDPLLSLQPTQ